MRELDLRRVRLEQASEIEHAVTASDWSRRRRRCRRTAFWRSSATDAPQCNAAI